MAAVSQGGWVRSTWVGADDLDLDQVAKWTHDGSVVDDVLWGTNQPIFELARVKRLCAAVTGTWREGEFRGQLNMRRCSDKLPAVCGVALAATPCAANPCKNGGACQNMDDGTYTCDCSHTFYSGATCEDDELECAVNNGGCTNACEEVVGGPPLCTCFPGFSSDDDGATCVADDCTGNAPCGNGGVCTGTAPNATCQCGPFFDGATCNTDFLECAVNNGGCGLGTCIEVFGGPPECQESCEPGFQGLNCDPIPNYPCSGNYSIDISGKWCALVTSVDTMRQRMQAESYCRTHFGADYLPIVRTAREIQTLFDRMVRRGCARAYRRVVVGRDLACVHCVTNE